MLKTIEALLACSLLLVVGCATGEMYETIKRSNADECNRLPRSQREKCLEQLPPDYETYLKQRAEAVEPGGS